MANIVIIGSNGYIGKHLALELSKQDQHAVTLCDVGHNQSQPGYEFASVDITVAGQLDISAVRTADVVFYFAGLTGTFDSFRRSRDFVNVNEAGVLNLLEALRANKSRSKIVFPSTRLVYKGRTNTPLKEDSEKEFKTVYAMNKYAAEHYLAMYHKIFGQRYVVFRLCLVYGNELDESYSYGTVGHFLTTARLGNDLTIYGDGGQKRTLTHVADAARIIVDGAFDPRTDNDVFNVGGPDSLSVKQIAEAIASKYHVRVNRVDWPATDAALESGDTVFDASKLEGIGYRTYERSFRDWIDGLQ